MSQLSSVRSCTLPPTFCFLQGFNGLGDATHTGEDDRLYSVN